MASSRKWRRYRPWIGAAVIVVVAAVAVVMVRSSKADDAPTTTYTTTAAEKGTLSVTVSGSGNLEIADSEDVWPDVGGTVESLEVKEGDKVKAGDVLFTIDGGDAAAAATKALASYQQAKGSVAQAEAQIAKANNALSQMLDRADAPSSTVTALDISAAKADVTSAKAQLASAKANRASALDSYNDAVEGQNNLEVTAPISGVVYACEIEEGDSVSASGGSASSTSGSTSSAMSASTSAASGSTAPITIIANKPLQATLSVNEVDFPSLKVGQRADLEFDALPSLAMTGKVTEISDAGTVEQGVVSFGVVVTLDVANAKLRPGMSVASTIITAVARDVLLVPNAAVKTDDNGDYVQVLDKATNQPTRVDVTVGLAGDTKTEILTGLEVGDEVITATADSSDASSSGRPSGVGMMMGGPR